jgi:hypothetical protein
MNESKQILLYGAGGVGKTNMLATLAKHLWKTQKKKTRVITVDGGGIGPLSVGIEMGAVEAIQCDSWQYPFRYFDLLSRGFWPSGPVGPDQWKTLQPTDKQKDWAEVGAICVEGITATGLVLMNYMRDRRANGEQIGAMDGKSLGMFKDGTVADGGVLNLGSNTMTDYGTSQSYLHTYVKNFRQLWAKGMPLVVWTALELKATDDSKTPVYGPMLPGKAATAACIPWFTDVLHLDVIDPKKQADGTMLGQRKVFLSNHYANTDPVPFLAKTSANRDGAMPNIIEPDFRIFFEQIDLANEKAKKGWE